MSINKLVVPYDTVFYENSLPISGVQTNHQPQGSLWVFSETDVYKNHPNIS